MGKNGEMLQGNEQTYRDLIDGMNDTVWIIGFDGNLIDVNRTAVEVLGYSKEELLSTGLFGIDSSLKKEAITSLASKMPEDKIQVFETTHKAKDGRIIPVEISSSIINYQGEKVILSIARDLTERKRIQMQLMKQSKELKELNATKDKFFSIIAHDLKGPFNAIMGLTDLLIQNYRNLDGELVGRSLQSIAGASNHAYALLENLLLWSHTQTGRVEYHPEMILLNPMIQETSGFFTIQVEKKQLHLVNSVPGDLMLFADKNMIGTILRNLLSNAIKFTPRQGEISIAAIQTNNRIEVSITDNGVGITPKNLLDIFGIENKITTPGTEKEKGSGLGLILCKEFVEQHGGKIWVESTVGKGSTFSFFIPCLTEEF
ncbi:MAG: PAS domain S-box protein [Bacteroidales bacterium]|nr:PAS domain S-box protein [Bacteroidales bacterium]